MTSRTDFSGPSIAPAVEAETASSEQTEACPETIKGPRARRPGLLAVMMSLATLTLLSWGLTRPALWLDECASVVATQRSWPDLWRLLSNQDAPLVPFYAVLKILTSATTTLFPATADNFGLLYRWPSVLAAVLAVGLLCWWVGRHCPAPVVLGTAVLLLASVGLSRYGQEARPYAIEILLATASIGIWSRMVNGGRRLWVVAYVLCVAALIAANSLAASMVAAELVAALIAVRSGRRRQAVLWTALGGALGAALISPFAITAAMNGSGATRYPTLTAENLALAFIHNFTSGDNRVLWVGPLLPFALIGLIKVASPSYRFVARTAAAWALVPPALLLPAVMLRPNLLIGRYLLFVTPGWAVLGGLGVLTVFELLRRVGRHAAPAALVTIGLLAAVVFAQLPGLKDVRGPAGHGEDIRPVLAIADSPPYAGLPIYGMTRFGTIEMGAYGQADENRLIAHLVQRTGPMIWPDVQTPTARSAALHAAPRLLLLTRAWSSAPNCAPDTVPGSVAPSAAALQGCIPLALQRRNYQVLSFEHESNWTLAVLQRPIHKPAAKRVEKVAAPTK